MAGCNLLFSVVVRNDLDDCENSVFRLILCLEGVFSTVKMS